MRLGLLLVLAACNSSPHKAQPGSGSGSGLAMPHVQQIAPPGYEARMEVPAIEVPKQELFELLDAGKGARTVLRYTLGGDHEQHAETQLSERTRDAGKLGPAVTLPAIRDGLAAAFAGDVATLRPLPAEFTGTSAPAEQYVAGWRAQLQNRRVDVTFDTRGQFTTIAFKDDPTNQRSAHAKDELVQRLLATTVPLPDAAVGAGASWRVITVLRQGPAYIKQTATYTLIESPGSAGVRSDAQRRGDKIEKATHLWKIKVKLLRVGEEQTLFDPALPRGTRIDLIAIFRLLEGTVEIDPRSPLFAAGSLTIESRVHAKVALPGKPAVEQFVEDLGSVTFTGAKP
jgi:hypothetical protein